MTQVAGDTSTGRYQIGDLTLDLTEKRVERRGRPIELGRLNFDLLRVLAEAFPGIVTHDELAERVWGRHFVSPENIAQRVMLLRQSLSDDASRPRYVEAVRGRGYRLIPTVQPLQDSQRLGRRWPHAAAIILLLLISATATLWRPRDPSSSVEPVPNSIAVLPFEDLSPNPDDAFLASGIHALIIDQLSKVPDISVIGRTSVRRYADADETIQDIAAALRVETILEGTVFYADDRVRITTTLIDASSRTTRWSDTYDRALDDVFAIQADIALNVARALGAQLVSAHAPYGTRPATHSPEAAELYLRAVDAGSVVNTVDTELQQRSLDLALNFDPNFANAYALKAELYALAVVDRADRNMGGRAAEGMVAGLRELALENANKALALDPESARAYSAIAMIHRFYWHWVDALEASGNAYARSPNDVRVLNGYSELLSWMGRHEQALRHAERIVELDPTSPAARWRLGIALAEAQRPIEAAVALAEAARIAPASAAIRHWQGRVEAVRGNRDEALSLLRRAERLAQGALVSPTLTAGLLYSYARIGQTEDVRRLRESLDTMAAAGPVGAGTWALTSLALGDTGEALRWLRAAVEKIESHVPDAGFLNLMTIKTNLMADPVLEDARFVELRNRIGAMD
jgi:TolB-like protein/DNA-binding winged helix-turn-helix (wHTH) protein/Flp pilus assembly protein TadD